MAITSIRTSSISNPQRFQSLAQATYVAPVPSTIGMVLLTPTSIAHSGTSASIGANGQVTFTTVTALSLNGVFTADFDNYMVSLRCSVASNTNDVIRLRASGTNATGSNYTFQYLYADSTSVVGGRSSSTSYWYGGNPASAIAQNGRMINFYGPYLAQPTAMRTVEVNAFGSAMLYDVAGTHSLSSSYDGFTLDWGVNTTGTLQVYGIRS